MPCPDANTLVAMIEHALDPARFDEVEVHLDQCEDCRQLVAASGRTGERARGTAAPPPTDRPEDGRLPVRAPERAFERRYELERVLGEGGMGKVYLARDTVLGREVALKVHRASAGGTRLHREAMAMAKLAHPNAVTVYDVGTVDARLYVAMEYVRGTTLRGWLAERPRAWREVIAMLVEAGGGLAAAHAAGLIHRDFKPENVLVGEDGRPRVGDFGLARVDPTEPSGPSTPELAADARMTEAGTVLGTPAYMAPEQMAGSAVDARADQFAFCVVAWESVYGARPYRGKTLGALAAAIAAGKLEPTRADVPDRVRAVLARGLSADPAHRFPDMNALLAALRAAAAPRTRRVLAIVAVATLLIGGAASAGASMLLAHRQARACTLAGTEIRDVFGPSIRAEVQRGFAASGSPLQAASFERTAEVLARHAARLANVAEAACRTPDEPARLLEARRACLAEQVQELRAFVELARHPDAAFVARAPSAAWAMVSTAPCGDTLALLARPSAAIASRALTAEHAHVRALLAAGRYDEAEARAATLLDAARRASAPDLELSTMIMLGELRSELGAAEQVVPLLQDALTLAERRGRDLEAIQVLAQLANLAGVSQQDYAAAHRHGQLALAKLERLGDGNPALRGALLVTEGQVFLDENRLGEAERALRRALPELERALGPEHPEVGAAMGTLSQVLRARGELPGSVAASERTLATLERALGPQHPTVAGAQMNLATAQIAVGRLDDARARLQRADRAFVQVFGEVHPVRAAISGNLGELEERAQRWDAARADYQQAIRILEATEGVASAGVSGARRDLARVLARQGKVDEAVAEQTRAIAILDELGDDGIPRIVSGLTELADLELARARFAAALPLAERALALGDARPADANPDDVALARYAVARALVGTKQDLVRARRLFDQARAAITDDRRGMLEAWRAGPGAVLR